MIAIICAYAAYMPALFIVEYAVYGRVDSERAFYALYFAFGAPYLLTASGRQYVRLDEFILNCVGAVLFAVAIVVANSSGLRSVFHRRES